MGQGGDERVQEGGGSVGGGMSRSEGVEEGGEGELLTQSCSLFKKEGPFFVKLVSTRRLRYVGVCMQVCLCVCMCMHAGMYIHPFFVKLASTRRLRYVRMCTYAGMYICHFQYWRELSSDFSRFFSSRPPAASFSAGGKADTLACHSEETCSFCRSKNLKIRPLHLDLWAETKFGFVF